MPARSSVEEVEQANRQLAVASGIQPIVDSQSLHNALEPVQALATHCSKVSDHKLLQQSGKATLEVLKACHDAANDPKDTSSSSKLYTAGFRALNSIIAALRSEHGMSTAELVELLRHFFTYGNELVAAATIPFTAATAGATAVAVTAAPGASQGCGSVRKAAYRPPHARRRSSSSTGWSDDASTGSWSGSESDTGNDSDSSRGSRASSQGRASAVRLAALTCLQQLAKADCRALHPFWIVLLPVYNPLQTKYHAATLMDAIVRDPLPKVRALAAAVLSSMLQGPAQKAYLMIAEAKSAARPPVRGFTTLSSTLGHLVIALHDGLLHAIPNEAQVPALVNMLKTLETLMLSAAYTRLPDDLLTRCLEVLTRRLHTAPQKLVAAGADVQAVQSAICACLAAAFGTKAAYPAVHSWLHAQAASTSVPSQGLLVSTLLDLSLTEGAGLLAQRTEALSALCGLAKNYTEALTLQWPQISHTVAHNMTANRLQSNGSVHAAMTPRTASSGSEAAPDAEAKCAQQAVRLLSEYLSGSHRLASASTSTPCTPLQGISPGHTHHIAPPCDELSSEEQQVSPPSVTKCSVHSHSANSTSATEQRRTDEQQCCVMWGEACDKHLPQAFAHSSPLVRSAAQLSLSDLPPPILHSLTLTQRRRIWQWVWHACQHDEAAAVRGAAAKCLGIIAGSVSVQECESELSKSLDILSEAIGDPTLSVRVSAASAAANVVDALQQQQQQHLDVQMAEPLSRLAAAVMAACQDNDKVHVNGVRGLGNLMAIHHLPLALANGHTTDSRCQWWGQAWLPQGIISLQTSLASSTEKVQWNACYAIGSLLRNDATAALAAKLNRLQPLLSALLALVRGSPTYKIRSHAAAALVNLGQRDLYEGQFQEALRVFCDASAGLQGSSMPGQDFADSGKNYQFKDALQQQLRQGLISLLKIVTQADMNTAAYAAAKLVVIDLETNSKH